MDDRIGDIEGLHRRYGPALYDRSLRMLGNAADAEDAVQETFVKAYRAWHQHRYGDSRLPWLLKINTNECLKILRTRRRKPTERLGQEEPPDAKRPLLEQQTHIRYLLAAMADRVDRKTWQIVVAHYVDGVPQQDIADRLGITRRTVVERLSKLRRLGIRGVLQVSEGDV